MSDFEQLVDLASARLGGAVLAANDDFFAEKENLVKDEAPIWIADRYTDRGKWMDGWESRRRRTPGHDWAIIRLGMPGVVRGVVVDTAFFKGNYPEACWIEGALAPHDASEEHLLGDATPWVEVLPRTPLAGDTKNAFEVRVPWRFTHLRLHIDPDGGVARLRVHGEVVPEPADVAGPGDLPESAWPQVDLAALEHGGQVIAASDMFFGSRHHLILPGASRGMHDGWETRRRRGPGHDWAIIRLAARGTIERAVVDTSHFKGNAPGTFTLEVADAPIATLDALIAADFRWTPLLSKTPLQPHNVHEFADALAAMEPATHACLRIFPDGGVARLRLFGRVDPAGRRALSIARLNALVPPLAEAAFHTCLGSTRFARAMAEARPFASVAALHAAAERAMEGLGDTDWREAFAAHPRIGASPHGGSHEAQRWAREEQSGAASAGDAIRRKLEEGNRAYEARFGWIFLISAAGRSAEEMLAALEARLHNDPAAEFRAAIEQQKQITRLRLEKLLRT
jgi:allantoicase